MRYGNVHRPIERPELCKEVLVLRPGLWSTIVECKLDMRDDGPDKEKKSKPSRAGVTLAPNTLPVPRLHRKPSLLHRICTMQRDICKHAAARVALFTCALEMTFAYPLIVSKKSFLEAVKFPEISLSDV